MRARFTHGLCLLALLLLWSIPSAQSQGDEPIAWEVVSDSIQVRSLTVSGDSTIYLTGGDGLWVWRRSDGTLTELNNFGGYTGVLMASTGRLFLMDSSIRMSTDYGQTTPLVVHEGKAIVEMPSRALVAVGDGGNVARSTDGGDTWTSTPIPVFDTVLGRDLALAPPTPDLPFGRLVTVGLGGAAVSDDDGRTWQETNLAQFFGYDAESVVYSAARGVFYTAMNGPVSDGGSQFGVVRASVDGRAWRVVGRLPTEGGGNVAQLAAGQDGSLWAVLGGFSDTSRGEVYRSEDGGASWASVGAFDGEALVGNRLVTEDVVVDSAGRVWVGFGAGVGGPRTRGLIVRTVEAVAASGEAGAPGTPSEAMLGAPYPNPAGIRAGAVTVPFTLAEPAEVRVVVYDVLGRTVALLYEGSLSATQHTWTIDTATLPRGVYAVRAMSAQGTAVRWFTVAR